MTTFVSSIKNSDCGAPRKERRRNRAGHSALYSYALPKVYISLKATLSHRVTIDACPGCDGIWLDKGAWEVLVGPQENGWLQRLFAGLIASKH